MAHKQTARPKSRPPSTRATPRQFCSAGVPLAVFALLNDNQNLPAGRRRYKTREGIYISCFCRRHAALRSSGWGGQSAAQIKNLLTHALFREKGSSKIQSRTAETDPKAKSDLRGDPTNGRGDSTAKHNTGSTASKDSRNATCSSSASVTSCRGCAGRTKD
jgi:hypothetical protein